jgi:hypothetical protein
VAESPSDDNVAALEQWHRRRQRAVQRPFGDPRHPWAGGVDEHAGCEAVASATDLEGETPRAVCAIGAKQPGAGPNHRPAFCSIDRIENHESTVVDLVTAACEPKPIAALKRRGDRSVGEIKDPCPRQDLRSRQTIDDEQAKPQAPR